MKLNINNAGLNAEASAAQYLIAQGLTLLTKNFSCRFGEIDLIMQDGRTLVFVEVRLRANTKFGSAAYSIDQYKQQKLQRTAHYYLQQSDINSPCRFDVVLYEDKELTQLAWIRNAFET